VTPLLSAIVFAPLVGAIAIVVAPRERTDLARGLAAAFSGVALALALVLFVVYDRSSSGLQFIEKTPWVPDLGISYFLGIDGLNLPMVLLTALLTFLAVLSSWQTSLRPKEYFAILLVLETGVLGVFMALDLALFFLFWEVELIPMYLLIGIWGGPRREYAAVKFVIYTLLGSALMLVGILALYFQQAGPRTFDMMAMSQMRWEPLFALVVFLFFFLGFAIKLPVFPFHTWLPDAHVEAPTAVSVLLAGVLLKMGGYGMLRIGVGILPSAAVDLAWLIGILAVVNVLYGAMLSLVQKDLKALVAYSSISHMGYVLLGIAGLSYVGLSGASIQMFTHGAITGLLFLLVGSVYDRTHTRQIADMRGLAPRMPLIAVVFSVASLASLGLPGLAGFVGEFTVFVGAFARIPVLTILGAAGIVLTAGYMLWMLQRVFFGPEDATWSRLSDVRGIELIPLICLVAVIVLVGVYPSILTDVVQNGAAVLGRRLGV
jgi:NADH-quinone oxidoreductase subunit M